MQIGTCRYEERHELGRGNLNATILFEHKRDGDKLHICDIALGHYIAVKVPRGCEKVTDSKMRECLAFIYETGRDLYKEELSKERTTIRSSC